MELRLTKLHGRAEGKFRQSRMRELANEQICLVVQGEMLLLFEMFYPDCHPDAGGNLATN